MSGDFRNWHDAALALGHFAVEGRPARLGQHPARVLRDGDRLDARAAVVRRPAARGIGRVARRRLALLLGATFTEINAVAARMPSGVVFWALPGDARPPVAWTSASRCRISRRTIRAAIRHRRPSPAAYAPFYRSQLRDARRRARDHPGREDPRAGAAGLGRRRSDVAVVRHVLPFPSVHRNRVGSLGASQAWAESDPMSWTEHHSITSSARASNSGSTVRLSAFAVLRLITNSTLVLCWIGRSAGFAPLRILPT
jgi:hypothetical protein